MTSPRRTLSFLLPTLFALSARAQPDLAPEGAIPQVAIKAGADAYDPRRDDTATKIVINGAELVKYGDSSIGDALRRLPGITAGGVPGRASGIRMRGLGNGYTQILLNGEPSPPGFALETLAPEMVERIEIMRAATAEYSTQAIAGTINIVLRRAVAVAQRDVKMGVRADNGQPGTSAHFQLADRAGIVSYAMAASMNLSRTRRADHGATTMRSLDGDETLRRELASSTDGTYQALNLAPRVTLNLGPYDTVTSQTLINATRYSGVWHEATATRTGAPPRFAAADGGVTDTATAVRTDVSWLHKMADEARFDVKLGINVARRHNDLGGQYAGPEHRLALDRTIDSATRDRGATTSARVTTHLIVGHTLSAGVDGATTVRGDTRLQWDTPGAHVHRVDDATVTRIALFAQDEWIIDRHWSGYAGMRWEGIRTQAAGARNASRVWSPLFQALYKLPGSYSDQVRLAVTRTYRAPTLANIVPQRLLATNNTPTTPDIQGNPAIKPELASSLDLAFEHYPAGGGVLSASGYLRRITDNVRSNVFLVDGAWVSMPVNTGAARTHGIELEAKFALRTWSRAAPSIDVRASLARNWSALASVPGANNRLASQTPFSSTLGLDYQPDRFPVTIGASLSFQNGGPVRLSTNEFEDAGPKRVLDLYALVKFDARRRLRLSVGNALHQDDMTATTWVDRSGALSDAVVTPTTTVFRAILEWKR